MNDNCIEKKNVLMYKTFIELVWFLYPKEMLPRQHSQGGDICDHRQLITEN